MKSRFVLTMMFILISVGFLGKASAQLNVALSADQSGIKEFYLAIGEQYRAPEKEIIVVKDRGIPDDEIPVVYFIARRASVEPTAVIDLRLGGMSWMDISLHYGLNPEIYYVDLKENPGPPYGNAYGYYRNRPRKEWKEIRLADPDIVNLVDLRFMSDRYGYSPDEIVKMRSRGDSFVKINGDIKHSKAKSHGPEKKKAAVKATTKSKAKMNK